MKKILVVLITVLISAGAELGAGQTALWEQGISLIPYPRQVRLDGGSFYLDGARLTLALAEGAGEADRFALQDLAERLGERHGLAASVVGSASGADVVFSRGTVEGGEQGYELKVTPESIRVVAGGEAGLFYATRTLLQLVQSEAGKYLVRGMEIRDWPDIEYRVAHYDTKHHQDKASYVRSFIRDLADYKMNVLLWEWEDKFAYRSHPEIGAPGAFTMEEMQEFTRYASKYHVQIVPLVQGLGHVSFILKWPQHAHLREIPASNWEFCPLKEGSYDLLFDLWDEAMEATPGSEFMHIGTDETYELGRGVECGCAARAREIGRYGLMQIFIRKSFEHIREKGRRVISWGGEYRPDENPKPPKGLIVAEYGDNLDFARESVEAGYPAWVYDPNPGIEHLFLPYFKRIRRGEQVETALENSWSRVSTAAASGLFEGMVNTSWDDSGLHNQVWMMSWINSAEFSWSGASPSLEEFTGKYFVSYYGPQAMAVRELFELLNDGGYYYMDTFERKVWHWGDVGRTHLPDLPRGDAIEYDPYWNNEYSEMIRRSREQLPRMERAINICRLNLERGVRNSYDFEVFTTIAELIRHTARTYLALASLENAITEAHQARFVSHEQVMSSFDRAVAIIEANLEERHDVFRNLVRVWEETRLPKGMSTPEKKFFHQQDRARHFAFRTPDMTYLIIDEQMLGLEDYLADLQEYMAWYRKTYLK